MPASNALIDLDVLHALAAAGRRIKKGKKGRRELELRRQRRVEAEAAAANNATANVAAGIDAATAAAIAAAVAEDYSDDEE
eukprot:6012-Heterococcus_DN1.PRE.1